LVVEAAARSGALITARLASEYNREVFAVPGRVQDPMSFGTNALIRDGAAKLVMSLEDILDELGEVGERMRRVIDTGASRASATNDAAQSEEPGAARPPGPLSAAESRVYEILGYDPVLQDVVLRAAELPAGEVLAALTALELKGLVRRLPGNLVVRRGTT